MSELPEIQMSVESVEMQEYLFSSTLCQAAKITENNNRAENVPNFQPLQNQIRECFRFHRFAMMNWLMMNGVSIPQELLSDQTHPLVGSQMPDKKMDL